MLFLCPKDNFFFRNEKGFIQIVSMTRSDNLNESSR